MATPNEAKATNGKGEGEKKKTKQRDELIVTPWPDWRGATVKRRVSTPDEQYCISFEIPIVTNDVESMEIFGEPIHAIMIRGSIKTTYDKDDHLGNVIKERFAKSKNYYKNLKDPNEAFGPLIKEDFAKVPEIKETKARKAELIAETKLKQKYGLDTPEGEQKFQAWLASQGHTEGSETAEPKQEATEPKDKP